MLVLLFLCLDVHPLDMIAKDHQVEEWLEVQVHCCFHLLFTATWTCVITCYRDCAFHSALFSYLSE